MSKKEIKRQGSIYGLYETSLFFLNQKVIFCQAKKNSNIFRKTMFFI